LPKETKLNTLVEGEKFMPTSNWANNWGSRKGFLYKRVPGPWPWYESGDWRFINPLAGMHNKKPEKRFASLQLRMKAAKTVKTEADATLRQAIGTLRFEIAQHELGQSHVLEGSLGQANNAKRPRVRAPKVAQNASRDTSGSRGLHTSAR